MRDLIDIAESYEDAIRPGGVQTETPAFQKWFAGSKVVTSDGRPMVMFHGTTSDIEEFMPEKITPHDPDAPFNGFWFSSDCETSPAWTNPTNIMPVFLSIKNPAPWKVWRKVARDVREDGRVREGLRSGHDEVRHRLMDMGYDGIVFERAPEIDRETLANHGKVEFQTVRGHKQWLEKGRQKEVEWKEVPYEHEYRIVGRAEPTVEVEKIYSEDGTRILMKVLELGQYFEGDHKDIDWSRYNKATNEGEVLFDEGKIRVIVTKMVQRGIRRDMVPTGREFDTVELYDPHVGHVTGYSDVDDFLDSSKHETWVAFYPQQIKSAFNRGTWNPESRNILETFEQEEIIGMAGDVAQKIKNPFNYCKQAAKMLASHLEDCGYEPEVLRCSGLETYAPNADKRWIRLGKQLYWTHYVVLCEGIIIDLTRRQFFPDAAAVYTTTVEDMKKDWLEMDRVPADDWKAW